MQDTKFLVCPDRKHFYAVQFFANEKALQKEIAAIRGKKCKEDKNVRALCLRYRAQRTDSLGHPEVTPELGSVFLLEQDRKNLEVVVHELTHAAVGWANRIGIQPILCNRSKRPTDEERFAACMQTLFAQYLQKCLPSPTS